MSYLKDQISSFQASTSNASSKVANKRVAVASSDYTSSSAPTPSVASSRPAAQNESKRKRPDPTAYSQPADTGTGKNLYTQMVYAVEYIKDKGRPQTLTDIISYLNIHNEPQQYKDNVKRALRKHAKVQYHPKDDGGEGTYAYRSIYDIQTGDEVLAFLQDQKTAQGLEVKKLKDGWPDIENTIDELETLGKLLVTRNKKDDHARWIWLNDPSLDFPVDKDFQSLWHKIKLPEAGALADELEKAGLQPANKSRGIKVDPIKHAKKPKKPRKGGKTTNTHMAGVLRDFSHLKK